MLDRILVDILEAYFVIIFLRIILTWFPIEQGTVFARIEARLAKVTDPVLIPVRKLLPRITTGSIALDLSPIIVLIILGLVIGLLGGKNFLGGI